MVIVLFWLMIALQVGLSSTAFAAATPQPLAPLPAQDVTRAGVSVVRLILSYMSTDSTQGGASSTSMCTGLGVLVRSQRITDHYENWVLTDGSLVNNEKKAPCLSSGTGAELSGISIYTSSSYNTQQIIKFDRKAAEISVHCPSGSNPCVDSAALLRFNSSASEPQPFIDLATVTASGQQDHALSLLKNDKTLVGLHPSMEGSATLDGYTKQLEAYRLPVTRSLTDQTLEIGTPIVNSVGELVGMHGGKNVPLHALNEIQSFLNVTLPEITPSSVVSPVHDNWKNGMDAYYQQKAASAHLNFQKAFTANNNFQAAQLFQSMSGQTATETAKAAAPSPAPANGVTLFGLHIPYWQLAVAAAVVVLLVVLILFLLWRVRVHKHQRVLEDELADAEQRATIEAQRIRLAEKEAAQKKRNMSQSGSLATVQPPMVATGPLGNPMLRCPRCGEIVSVDDNFCASCQQQLAPADNKVQQQYGRSPLPASTAGNHAVRSSTPPVRSIADQTTIVPASAIAEQPTVVPGRSISEQPTVDIPDSSAATQELDPEKTVPYSMRQLSGRQLGLMVGAKSDPGIKRKYKPNEDSLFAAQGLVNGASKAPLFGLFVVADGMGGHANGEDASRLAIQTIVNYMLPKISGQALRQSNAYEKLLIDGVQEANLAVHQNNLQKNADMGTTITATLVVDGMAYIVNVGDSRTYLYRPAAGLRKVTLDHSVVASLVEAGIIKPDDIYTHPKRNQIYRSLGEKPAIEIDSFKEALQPGDKIVLCSDGLWDMVRDPKIEAVVKNPDPDPAMTGEALIKAALEGGGEDNVSVVIVQVTEPVETSGMPRLQLVAKPDSVEMPQLP
ncbi:hypothetical protein KDA_25780 [Dictyobacter alpinus]|uniref:PPM-type phosphatase domain-containing protein n=1 Tax=Dictyobacter alpinus TaxID=2014873 RepID=A0A402B6W5_9CHLR|nr:protein phosphatase 2C domain-containing protein [Dictyobacter alpinus]GCE27094.1 hypothetical protein KDA_25780 [Dictyobacter alpinus]